MGLAEFLAADALACGDHWLVWYRAPRLWMTVFWGRPVASEMEQVVRLFDFALDERMDPTYLSLFDCASVDQLDTEAFSVLARYLLAKKEQFQQRLAQQALVRPDGVVGAVVAGALASLEYRVPSEVFTEVEPALEWLVPREGGDAAAELAKRVARARQQPPVERELRSLLDENLGLELAEAARALGRAPRTLQRQLEEAKTSFRTVRITARMERAQQLLSDGDTKVTSIALEVGCASLQHFARLFRAHTGLTPLAWRRRRRP